MKLLMTEKPLSTDQLSATLSGYGQINYITTRHEVDLSEPFAVVEEMRGAFQEGRLSQGERARWDRRMVAPVHIALSNLSEREAADMRLWHRLCTHEFAEFVWLRWHGMVPADPANTLETHGSLQAHFLGRQSLVGVSRNALARLWWVGHALRDVTGGYELAEKAIGNQDLFVSVFERRLGLCTPVARAVISHASESQRLWRRVTETLNHVFTTIAPECLPEETLARLVAWASR